MTVPPDAVSVELLVPFHDVDGLHVVWHGHYVKYLEIARQELLRRKRLDIPDLETLGVRMMVAQTHLKHGAPLLYSDRFRVSTWLTDYKVRFEFQFEVFNLTAGRRAATARSVLVVVRDDGELCFRVPDEMVRRIESP